MIFLHFVLLTQQKSSICHPHSSQFVGANRGVVRFFVEFEREQTDSWDYFYCIPHKHLRVQVLICVKCP